MNYSRMINLNSNKHCITSSVFRWTRVEHISFNSLAQGCTSCILQDAWRSLCDVACSSSGHPVSRVQPSVREVILALCKAVLATYGRELQSGCLGS